MNPHRSFRGYFSERLRRDYSDPLQLRTRLVRGRFDGDNRSVGHAWNLVWSPSHKSWFLIDVMHDPRRAFEEESGQFCIEK